MVRIRGGNSISAKNDPLYVVDGVPLTTNLEDGTPGTLLGEGMRGLNPLAATFLSLFSTPDRNSFANVTPSFPFTVALSTTSHP